MPLAELLKIEPRRIDVALLPSMVRPEQLQGRTVVVTDVLRATTTTIQALYNGCTRVFPQPDIESAKKLKARIPDSVLGGERGGQIIPGFDCGNSPLEYTASTISGKSLILATTNGTVAMERCRLARRVLIGAMINVGAVCDRISSDEPVTIVCSGTDGEITSEDLAFAGALIERMLMEQYGQGQPESQKGQKLQKGQKDGLGAVPETGRNQLSDSAWIALTHWQQISQAIRSGAELKTFFKIARGGINLVKVGLADDINFAAQIDIVSLVPELNTEQWVILRDEG